MAGLTLKWREADAGFSEVGDCRKISLSVRLNIRKNIQVFRVVLSPEEELRNLRGDVNRYLTSPCKN